MNSGSSHPKYSYKSLWVRISGHLLPSIEQKATGGMDHRVAGGDPRQRIAQNTIKTIATSSTTTQSPLSSQLADCSNAEGRIGLCQFLFHQKIAGIKDDQCPCGQGRESVHHVLLICRLYRQQREATGLRNGNRIWGPYNCIKGILASPESAT